MLGFPSAFLSAHYEAYPWRPRDVGEVYPPEIDYTRRGTPNGLSFEHVCGSVEDFQLGATFDPTLNVLYDNEWIPLCCGRDDVCTTNLCAQAQVAERPAAQLYSYPMPHQDAAPGTPFHLFQIALNQGEQDPAWPGILTAFYPSGMLGDAGYSQAVVADDSGRMQFVEETVRFDANNAITQSQTEDAWTVTVEQGGVSGAMFLAVVGGELVLSGTNFVIDPTILPPPPPPPPDVAYVTAPNVFELTQTVETETATTNAIDTVLSLIARSTGTVANQFGEEILFSAQTASGNVRELGALVYRWAIAADATRQGQFFLRVSDTVERNAIVARANGSAIELGFFGVGTVVRPTALGSVAGFTPGVGTAVTDDATFTGGGAGGAYTIDDIVGALKSLGLLS